MKFRVWDSRNKRDATIEEDWFLTRHGDLGYFDGINGMKFKNQYVPEFYSGVFDKNGREICENDVVVMPAYPRGKWITKVYFEGGKFAVDGSNYDFKDLKSRNIEVIGTVHDADYTGSKRVYW